MPNKVVHVGYPKTGSSFLQKHVFPYLHDYKIVQYSRGKTFSHYVLNSGMFFNFEKALSLIDLPDENVILSDEALVGNPIKGIGINDESTPFKLKECGFNKVIIVLRKDNDRWVKSLYNEFLKAGGKLSYADFLKNPERHNFEYSIDNPGMIEYCEDYARHYEKVFGKENTLILYLEDLRKNQDGFIKSMLEFIDSKAVVQVKEASNESMPRWMQSVVYFFNNFTSSRMAPSTIFYWFSTARVIRFLQLFSKKSITKYR